MTGRPTDKEKVIELQEKLIDNQSQIAEKDRQIAELVKSCDALTKEVQRLKQPMRASTDHDKIRKKGKFDGRDKRWEEAMKEENSEFTIQVESKIKRTKRKLSKESALDRMLKKRRG